jgi:hypothetical protein
MPPPAPASALADFFDALDASFATLIRRGSVAVRHYGIGGQGLSAAYADDTLLATFGAALRHLERAAAGDGWTLRIVDSARTGVGLPAPPAGLGTRPVERGEVHWHDDGNRFAYQVHQGVLRAFDARRRVAYWWWRDVAQVPPWEPPAPMRPLLGWWAEAHGAQLVHAAAVGHEDFGCLLLAARGGSGKSTLSAACLEAGWKFLGDDYVGLRLDAARAVTAFSLYCTIKLEQEQIRNSFPRLADLLIPPHGTHEGYDKHTALVHPHYGTQLAEQLPVRALIVPVLQPGAGLASISGAQALAALAPTTLLQMPGSDAGTLERIGRLIAGIPKYRLGLLPEHRLNVQALAELLRRQASAPPAGVAA